MGKNKNGLPSRWLNYRSIGQEIRGVPIIACKVPLREDMIRNKVKQDQWFTPEKLVEMVPNVGCVVDLTATDRYYNPTVFTERGIHHAKILCEGHVIPNPTTVQKFFHVVDEFLHNVHSRGKVLMVHCTHGLNRTGYLVSRYMVERRGFKPEDAIQAFNRARGHDIERANYLQDLHQLSHLVCRNPVALFQKSGHRPGHQEQTPASYDRPTSSSHGHNLRSGRSKTYDHPPPFPDRQPPPVAQSYSERPSLVTQPNGRHLTGPSHGQHQLNSSQGPSSVPLNFYVERFDSQSTGKYQGLSSSPLPPTDSYSAGPQLPAQHHYVPAPVAPYVPVNDYSQPPPPIINKLPNLRWTFVDNSAVQLNNNYDDRPNSANRRRSRSDFQHQGRGTSPVGGGRRKQGRIHSTPPPAPHSASSSEHRDRRVNRHQRFDHHSVDERPTSSTGISRDSRRVDPPAQRDGRRQDSKVRSHSERPSHRNRSSDRPGKSSPSSRKDFSPDRRAPKKRERSKRRKRAGRSTECS